MSAVRVFAALAAVSCVAACASSPPPSNSVAAVTPLPAPSPAPPSSPPPPETKLCGGEIDLAVDSDETVQSKFDCFLRASEVKDSPTEIMLRLLDDVIRFDRGSANLTPKHKEVLAPIAKAFRNSPQSGCITVIGHTDATGTDDINGPLSEARAKAVVDFLGARGSIKLRYYGVGAKQPANRADPYGPENRRIRAVNKCARP